MKSADSKLAQDSVGSSPPIRWDHTQEDVEDLVAFLRRIQASFPIRAVLVSAGSMLVCIGGAWAGYRVLAAHPYLPVLGLGLVCLGAAMATVNEGVIHYLPPEVQKFLLQRTVFDLLHDDASLINSTRRWVRMLLICYAGSAGEIESINEGLDPEFVQEVFHHTMIDWFPISVRRILLPANAQNGDVCAMRDGWWECSSAGQAHASEADLPIAPTPPAAMMAPHIAKAAVRLRQVQQNGSVEVNDEDVHHTALWSLLCNRREEVSSKYVEPDLTPVLMRVLMQSIWSAPGLRLLPSFRNTFLAGAAFWWGTAGLIWQLPKAQTFALRGLSMVGASGNRDVQLLRASRFAGLLGVLSFGAAIASMAFHRRFGHFLNMAAGKACSSASRERDCGNSKHAVGSTNANSRVVDADGGPSVGTRPSISQAARRRGGAE